jgi:hypothetical protein
LALLRSSPVLLIASATRLLLVANNDPAVATKVASSSGITGTLLGTLIPLLPLYLPLIVVALIITRHPLLALVAIGAMILVTPAQVSLTQWIHGMRSGTDEIGQWWLIHHGPGWHDLWPKLGRKLIIVVRDQWLLWVGGTACLIAIASAPERLRRTDDADLKKTIDERIKGFNEGWTDFIKVGGQKKSRKRKDFTSFDAFRRFYARQHENDDPPRKLTEKIIDEEFEKFKSSRTNGDGPFLNKLRIALRKPLLDAELKSQRYLPLWRAFYGLRLGLFATLLVGLVMQFYTIPITGIDPSQIARSMWLPAEKITVADQAQPTVGYVLSTSDSWFVVLTEQDRTIDYIKASAVVGRSVCSLNTSPLSGSTPLIKLAGATNPRTPSCFPRQ